MRLGGPIDTDDADPQAWIDALDDLDDELPVLLEYLDSEAAYGRAREYVREVADEVGASL